MIITSYRNCLKCDNEIVLINNLNNKNNSTKTVCSKCGAIHKYHINGNTSVLQVVEK